MTLITMIMIIIFLQIKKVDPHGLFRRAARGKTTGVLTSDLVEWAITEINMQPINFNCTTEQVFEIISTKYVLLKHILYRTDF